MTMKETAILINLEKRFHLLSADMIYQEDLFKIQEALSQLMVDTANKDKTGKIGQVLSASIPYIFSTT